MAERRIFSWARWDRGRVGVKCFRRFRLSVVSVVWLYGGAGGFAQFVVTGRIVPIWRVLVLGPRWTCLTRRLH